jgi:hypothetical protein
MKKIIFVICCLAVAILTQAQTGSQNDRRVRCYLDLTKSVKSTVTYHGKEMYQFLGSKYTIQDGQQGGKDTIFENILLWVEASEGEQIMSYSRSMWIEGAWVKWSRGRWVEVKNPSEKDIRNQKVVCKIYNYGQIGPLPGAFGGTGVVQNNNGTTPVTGKVEGQH